MITFVRVNNDINGNPRYVCHFSDLLNKDEYASALNNLSIDEAYNLALEKAKKIGGKRYCGNDFGGGIVFQSYNLTGLNKQIDNLKNE
jgi:hypothetical protein